MTYIDTLFIILFTWLAAVTFIIGAGITLKRGKKPPSPLHDLWQAIDVPPPKLCDDAYYINGESFACILSPQHTGDHIAYTRSGTALLKWSNHYG